MTEQAGEPFGNWQALARESWEAWLRKMQPAPAAAQGFGAVPGMAGDDVFARGMAGMKAYLEWMQGAAAAGASQPPPDWPGTMQQMFERALGGVAPFAGMAGTGGPSAAAGAGPAWQAAWSALRQHLPGAESVAAFGPTREQQLQQQAWAAAMMEYLEAQARYQSLIQRAHAQGMQQMQQVLSQQVGAGQPSPSAKAVYDAWVDAVEEAYAEVALSDEFRQTFGAMSNAQMRLRQLQQQHAEKWCREQGMPTRSEVASLGQRVQDIRRELRKVAATPAALRAEIDAMQQRLAVLEGKCASAPLTKARSKAAKSSAGAVSKRATPAKSAKVGRAHVASRGATSGKAKK